jgi:ligand-binding sensor domain-containing protein/signal transduction histidine kinase
LEPVSKIYNLNWPELCVYMTPRLRYFLVLVSLFGSCSLWAQQLDLEFERFNTNDGLSQNHVFSIVQDHSGFLWFGTDDGLNRFDGHEFKVFRHSEADTNTIVDNSIRALLVGRDSSIWIGTNSGICRYFPKMEKIVRYVSDFTNPTRLSGYQVSSILEHDDGSIWVTYIGDGVNVIVPGSDTIVRYTVNRNDELKLSNDMVSSLVFMPNGDKVIGTLHGLQVINSEGNVMSDSSAARRYPWIRKIGPSVSDMVLSRNKEALWITTELSGFYRIDLQTQMVSTFSKLNGEIGNNHVICALEDSKNNVWIGSEVIYFYHQLRKQLLTADEYDLQEDVVIRNPIYSLFEDRDGNIWFGTQRMGVLKYNPQNKQVSHYHANMGAGSIKSNLVISFGQAAGKDLWVGTDGEGLFHFDVERGIFTQHPLQQKFSSKVIKTIYKDPSGNLWLGTWDGGFMRLSASGQALEIFNPENKKFPSHHVWAIAPDSLGNFWLGTLRDGLCYFSPRTGKYEYYKLKPGDTRSLVNNDVMTLLVDSRKNLWVGTANGLSLLKAGKKDFINFVSDGSDTTLSGNVIQSLYEDRNGNVWVGTNGGGITIFTKDLSILKIIKQKHGLPSNTICSLQPDLHDNLWASTYKGLVKINYRDFTVVELPHIGGLREKEFSNNASFSASDGRLLFGGSSGFDLFHPDSLNFQPTHENVTFTSLKIFNDEVTPYAGYKGRQVLDKTIAEAEQVDLSYTDYSFTLTFAPLSYNWQRTIHYAYFMENLDNEWQYTTADRRFVHYSNLTPGNYLLKVKASYDGQHWSDHVKKLRITIHPPWWATLGFKIGSGLLLCLTLAGVYKFRMEFLERQQKKLTNLVDLRTGELKQSYDQLQTKNRKIENQNEEIQILLEELEKQKNDIEQKNEELQTQHDTLSVKSAALEKAQKRLEEINSTLEKLIERRTNKLNTAVRELETFLYRASHDLRGPISSMLGLIRVAELENGERDQVYINFLRKTTMRLERTLAKLVQKHTIQKSKLVPEVISKAGIEEMLHEIVLDIPHFRAKDFQVNIDPSFSLQSDKTMLNILLSNLLENAFFFSEQSEKTTVILEMRQTHRSVTISVTDFGPGIKEELKDKIFLMFYRGHELSDGNGLGLYLVQHALLRINGKISVETTPFTRFTIAIDPL